MTWLLSNWQWLLVFIVAVITAFFAYKSIKKSGATELKAEHRLEATHNAKVAVVEAVLEK